MKLLCVMFLALLVTACGGNPLKDLGSGAIEIDSYLLEECVPLEENVVIKDETQLWEVKAREAKQYSECKKKQKGLANVVKKAFNLEKK